MGAGEHDVERIRSLGDRLRRLLSQVQAADQDGAAAWASTWRGCHEEFRALEDSGFDLASLDESDHARAVELLEEALRLNAVITSLIARQSEELEDGLQRIATVRKKIRAAAAQVRTGGSCDIAG